MIRARARSSEVVPLNTRADVIVIGAGAAGMMCAATAAERGRRVLVVDHGRKPGAKIRISGGGRCNFTNLNLGPENYLSANPHFCKSALSRYTQWDFLDLIGRHGIAYHERDHGQLFCDGSAQQIIDLLVAECRTGGVEFRFGTDVADITRHDDGRFRLQTAAGPLECASLVIATGGLSLPPTGASPFGYRVAERFGLTVVPTRPGLVPLTLHPADKQRLAPLTGIAVPSVVRLEDGTSFREAVLLTHRGLSGPAILQISSYWEPGREIEIDWLPDLDLAVHLQQEQQRHPRRQVKTVLQAHLPRRLVAALLADDRADRPLGGLSRRDLEATAAGVKAWRCRPAGSEGYRTAEVTVGGVACDDLSSRTLGCRDVPGLFFIGEVIDVTGWLGGYNFQWAWSSGRCAGLCV